MAKKKKTGINVNKMRDRADERDDRAEFFKFDPGETLVFVHPPCEGSELHEDTEGMPYLEVGQHYALGPDDGTAISLDVEKNPILTHPRIADLIAARGVELPDECPIALALKSGDFTPEEVNRSRFQRRFLWGLTPIAFRKKSTQKWQSLSETPAVTFVGTTVHSGLEQSIFEAADANDCDPTDPRTAVFAKVKRSGTGMQTEYDVRVDLETGKKPKKLDRDLADAILAAVEEEGNCNLFRIVSNLVKGEAQVQAILEGVDFEEIAEDDRKTKARERKRLNGKRARRTTSKADEEPIDTDNEDEPPHDASAEDGPYDDDPPRNGAAEDDEGGDDLDEIDREIEELATR